MSETTTTNEPGIRAFSQLFAVIENGNLHGDLSREVENLIAALQDAAGGQNDTKGKINISLDFKYDAKSQLFEISGDYKVTSPKEKRGKSIFWATKDNLLTRQNPRQQEMFPPRDVSERQAARNL